MKKLLMSLGLASSMALASVPAQAATLLGFEVGAYSWDGSAKGSVNATDLATNGIKADTSGVTYLAFEHPVPIVPNVKLQLTDMAANSTTETVDLSHTDSILYYEILDNDLVSVDLGITVRDFSGDFNGAAISDTVYLAYGSAVVGIPGTGLSLGMELHQDMGIDDDQVTDTKLRVMYELAAGLGIELGQRTVTTTLQESTTVKTQDLEFDGSYIALTYTF